MHSDDKCYTAEARVVSDETRKRYSTEQYEGGLQVVWVILHNPALALRPPRTVKFLKIRSGDRTVLALILGPRDGVL